jgi:hypothetical protein
MAPAPAVEEDLQGAILEIERALEMVDSVRQKLIRLRGGQRIALPQLVDELSIAPCEACHDSCVMASDCFARAGRDPALLGDTAAAVLGEIDLDRARALVTGAAAPENPDEESLAAVLRDAGRLLGITPDELERRLA